MYRLQEAQIQGGGRVDESVYVPFANTSPPTQALKDGVGGVQRTGWGVFEGQSGSVPSRRYTKQAEIISLGGRCPPAFLLVDAR